MSSDFNRYTTSKGRQILSGHPTDRTKIQHAHNNYNKNQVASKQFINDNPFYQYNPNYQNHAFSNLQNNHINRKQPRKFDQSIVFAGAPQPKFSHSSVRDPRTTLNMKNSTISNANQNQTGLLSQNDSYDGKSDYLDGYSSRKNSCCPFLMWLTIGILIFAGIGIGALFGGRALAESRRNESIKSSSLKLATSDINSQQSDAYIQIQDGKIVKSSNKNENSKSNNNINLPVQTAKQKQLTISVENNTKNLSFPTTQVEQQQGKDQIKDENLSLATTSVKIQDQVSPIDNTKPQLTAFMIPIGYQQQQTDQISTQQKPSQSVLDVGESSFMYPPQINKIHRLIF